MNRKGLRRKGVLLLTLVLCMLWVLPVPAAAASFPDVDETSEYADATDFLSRMQIMIGDEKGNFNPNKTVTRAEMAAIVCRACSVTDELKKSAEFSDVPLWHWANSYVGKAAEMGIVNGYGGGRFGPSDNVTYEQAVTMLVRSGGLSDEAVRAGGYPDGFLSVAEKKGFLKGVQAAKGEPLSRADIAMILYNGADLLVTIE